MFLGSVGKRPSIVSFPHAGGDVSKLAHLSILVMVFSPRRWGCFRYCLERSWLRRVFPTQVGMFLSRRLSIGRRGSFPHAGGDVSIMPSGSSSAMAFSPRRWGCFPNLRFPSVSKLVFPTQVGMFLNFPLSFIVSREFSPRRWGCFHNQHSSVVRLPVFPTQVGMFPTIERSSVVRARFSPRRWGCFRDVIATIPTLTVFPTQVGMFPWL